MPDLRARIERIFSASPFIGDIGITFLDCGPGWCETAVDLQLRHMQFTGVVHAGVVATLADHTAGAAAVTMLDPGKGVVTSEFKLSLLRGAKGHHLACRGTVLKSGRIVSFVEAEVHDADRRMVAKLSATMVTVDLER